MRAQSRFIPLQLLLFSILLSILASAAYAEATEDASRAKTEIETPDYAISPSQIALKSYLNAFQQLKLNITNKKPTNADLAIIAEGTVAEILKLGNTTLKIAPHSSKAITLTFLSAKSGEFNGTIKLLGSIIEDIFVKVKIANSEFPTSELLTVQVEAVDKKPKLGKPLMVVVELQNLLVGRAVNTSVSYFLAKENRQQGNLGNLSETETPLWQENLTINTSVSMLKILETKGMEEGDYAFEARAHYEDNTLSSKARFSLTKPLPEKKLFGIITLKHVFLAVVAGALLAGGFYLNRKRQQKKKRYVSKLYLDQLPKPGARVITLGKIAETNRAAYFDLDQLQTHTLIAGSTGGGKTVSAQVFIEEALIKGVSAIVFDPTAQWTGFLRKNTDKKMFGLYPSFGMKPSDARAFSGNVRQISDAKEIIDIRKFIRPGEITVFAINKLEPEDIDIIVANIVRQVFKANLPEGTELRLVMVFDEVHRLLPKFGGSGQGFLQIERAAREFRKWGIGLFLISQVLTDFAGETKANISTEVQMRTRDQGDLDRIKTKYGDYMLQSLLKSATGTGMLENTAYNKGEPFFVAFRPLLHNHAALSDGELEGYNKYNSVLDELDYQLEQLRQEGVDVFDVELELKLAKDKLKTGNFSMVDIYLESLRPRLAEEWKKLGKKPKQYKIQLLSEEELKKEHEIALKARQKIIEEEGKGEKKNGMGAATQEFRPLRLKSGIVALNPRELEDALQTMSQADFSFHLNDNKNDFANWAEGPEPGLAKKFREAKTKEDILKALTEFQHPSQPAKAEKK